jgi:DNA-binding beta-propeller fold protein YncE
MKKNYSNLLALLTFLVIFSSCGDSEELDLKTAGVYIYHEGGFGSNNATIGSYDPDTYEYNPDLYSGQNGIRIGDVQQNILVENNVFYSVLNGSNSIDIMGDNLKSESKIRIPELDKPRDIAVTGDIAFIANWGPYDENFSLVNSEILVVDLSTNELIDKIDTQEYPEHLTIKNNKLIVSHASFDGSISELSVINIDNLQIEQTIDVPSGPQEFEEDDNGNIWVVCTSGSLIKLNASLNGIENEIALDDEILGDIDFDKGLIYFYSKGEILYIDTSGNTTIFTTEIKVEMEAPYAFAVDPVSGDFYLGDALDFSSEGLVIRYSNDGELIDTFESGIIPTQFTFNIERN